MSARALLVFLLLPTCALPERSSICVDGGSTAELFGVASCDVCAAEQCCAEASRCAADAGCQALMGCFRGCSDQACFAKCRDDVDFSAEPVDALLDCAASRCEDGAACVLPERMHSCPTAGAVADAFGIASCDLCIRGTACEQATACAQSEACRARLECMSACRGARLTPDCFDQCRADPHVGVGDSTLFRAVSQNCREECRIGSAFDCVEGYRWPTTGNATVTFETRALNRLDGEPFVGLTLTPCSYGSTPCVPLGTSDVTDASGIALVEVPTINGFDPVDEGIFSGFRGYYLFDHPEDDTDYWVDTLLVRSRPDYRDRTRDEPAPFVPGWLLKSLLNGIAGLPPAVSLDASRGSVVGAALDCHGMLDFFAHGIVAEVDGADELVRIAYINAEQTALDTSLDSTSVSGQFAMINVVPGERVFTFRRAATGEVVAKMRAAVEAGRATIVGAWPLAAP